MFMNTCYICSKPLTAYSRQALIDDHLRRVHDKCWRDYRNHRYESKVLPRLYVKYTDETHEILAIDECRKRMKALMIITHNNASDVALNFIKWHDKTNPDNKIIDYGILTKPVKTKYNLV